MLLKIYDWTGLNSGGGTDQVFFGNSATGLSATQLGQIAFYSDFGSTSLGFAQILSDGEIVPVPEPSTVFAAILVAAAVGYFERRQVRFTCHRAFQKLSQRKH